jgi:protein SCO1/2
VRRTTTAVLACLAGVVVLTSCASESSGDTGSPVAVSGVSSRFHGTALTRHFPLPDQRFTDTAGRAYVPSTDATAPVTLVFFGYTHCPDVCNVVLANVAAALRRSSPQVQKRTKLLFVTTDPRRDTPHVMRDYLDRFDTSYVGLRASIATTKVAAAALHVAYDGTTTTTAGGGYEVDHGTAITAFRDGKAAVLWSADTPVADLRADLTSLAAG